MSDIAYMIQFLSPYIWYLILIVISVVWICIWAIHYIRKEQACNPQKSKRRVKGEAFLLAFLKCTSSHKREDPVHWRQEIREFKRDCEIAELKHRKCRAKLPERPDWKCTCGRINLAHTATCLCGKNMRDIPVEIRTNISEEELSWKCLCGLKNAGHTSVCTCGRTKHDIPLAVRTPTMNGSGTWNCSCGRENPGYTYTCVCGKSKH